MQENFSIVEQISMLAIQLGCILFAARFCGRLMEKMRVPSVLGELLAGVVIGPYLLGAIPLASSGAFSHGLFPLVSGTGIPVSTVLYGIATLGSVILLFISGLETDLRMFFRYSVAGTVVGLGGVVFSFAFGAGMGLLLLHYSMMDPRCLFLGILSTATSVGITARILSEKRSIDSPEGTTILAAAVIDDVLGIICLAIVMGIVSAQTGGSAAVDWGHIEFIALKSFGIWLGVTAFGLGIAHWVARFLKLFRPSCTYAILAFGLALLLAGLFEQAGLAMIVGAYVMGLSLSKTDIAFAIRRSLNGLYGFLVPVFFVVMGMLVNVHVFANWQVVRLGLIYSLLAVLAKLLGCALPALFLNFNWRGALRIGAGMIPRGEVALIIAGIGATTMMTAGGEKFPVVGEQLFGVAIIMTLLTTMAAPPLLSLMLSLRGRGVRKEIKSTDVIHTEYRFPQEILRETLLRAIIENFRREGFRHSELDNGELIHFRREKETFSMHRNGEFFVFESVAASVVLIRTVMYETLVELHRQLAELKKLAEPSGFGDAVIQSTIEVNASSEKPENRLNRIVSRASVVSRLAAKTHEEAITELVRALNDAGKLQNAELCLKDIMIREGVVSTCLPCGIALPHARTEGVEELTVAIGLSQEGCLSSATAEKVRIYVLSICPKTGETPYLQFVGRVAALLSQPQIREKLFTAAGGDEIRRIFCGKAHLASISAAAAPSGEK